MSENLYVNLSWEQFEELMQVVASLDGQAKCALRLGGLMATVRVDATLKAMVKICAKIEPVRLRREQERRAEA